MKILHSGDGHYHLGGGHDHSHGHDHGHDHSHDHKHKHKHDKKHKHKKTDIETANTKDTKEPLLDKE